MAVKSSHSLLFKIKCLVIIMLLVKFDFLVAMCDLNALNCVIYLICIIEWSGNINTEFCKYTTTKTSLS